MHFVRKLVEKTTPVKFFIATSLVFGVTFIVITPPFQAPDEPFHFLRVYQLSEGRLGVDNVQGKMNGDYFPKSLDQLIALTTTNPTLKHYPNNKYDVGKNKQALHISLEKTNTVFFPSSKIAQYPPVDYALQVIAVSIAKLINAPPVMLLYIARLAGLATWILLFALAIKAMPYKKWAVAYIGLLPTALFQASMTGADAVTIGVASLYVAYILKIVAGKNKLGIMHVALLTALASMVALSKNSSAVIIFLALLIPARQFLSSGSYMISKYFCKLVIIVTPLLLAVTWILLSTSTDSGSGEAAAINEANPAAQLAFILQNPHSFINVLWNTYFFSWGDTITRSFVGNFGWVDAPLSEIISVLGYIGLAFAIFVHSDGDVRRWLRLRQKAVVALILGAYAVGVSLALYLYYSPVGFKIILGLQGRYFLPVATLLPALLQNTRIKTDKRAYVQIIMLTSIALLISSVITIFFRYYVNNV